MKSFCLLLSLAIVSAPAMVAQSHENCPYHQAMTSSSPQMSGHQHAPAAPAADGLSDDQVSKYLNGEGMGLAKPAELNHYPGPRHVLDAAPQLALSAEQLAATRALFENVNGKAKVLGKEIVDREQELVGLFREQRADAAQVQRLTSEIAALQGQLRALHLSTHLQQRALLTSEQVRKYDELRSYVPGSAPAPHQHQ